MFAARESGARYLLNVKRWYWVMDAAVVISFALVGSDVHTTSSQVSNIARITLPFLVALAIATVMLAQWRSPLSLSVGLLTGLTTLAVGMALRNLVWSDGTPLVFIVVSGVWFIGLMSGWRLARISVLRVRNRHS